MNANHQNSSALEPTSVADCFDPLVLQESPPSLPLPEQGEDEDERPPKTNGASRRRVEGLDDPVRMYLKQMGPVALLTAEQEVEICRRIEKAQNEVTQILYHLGFAAKEHIALAERLLATPPQERFDRVISDRKIECRDKHLKYLARLVNTVRRLDEQADQAFAAWHDAADDAEDAADLLAKYKTLDK